jgi:large subunit ribosomal protein L3
MKKGILGKKLGMTQVYDENGTRIPVTVIEVGPCPVLALRKQGKEGYSAIQLGFGSRKAKNTTKGVRGQVRAAGLENTPPAVIREVRLDADAELKVGDVLKADVFQKGDIVDVTGVTKGRGFQGVVRRWRFAGGRASHGGGWVRRGGSIGMKVHPGRTLPGQRMGGHMGNANRTVQNLRIVDVRLADDVILVSGAIPGPTGGTVMVRSAVKK